MVLCKQTSDYYCADIESLYRVVSVVHNSSMVTASDLVIINVFGNISFVSLMGFSVTVMHSARCCNIHSLRCYTSCWKTTSAFFHLFWSIIGLIPLGSNLSCYVTWRRRFSNTAGHLDTQHEGIFDSVQVRKQSDVDCAVSSLC